MENQATCTMIQFSTQSDCADTELTNSCPTILIPSGRLGRDKYQFCKTLILIWLGLELRPSAWEVCGDALGVRYATSVQYSVQWGLSHTAARIHLWTLCDHFVTKSRRLKTNYKCKKQWSMTSQQPIGDRSVTSSNHLMIVGEFSVVVGDWSQVQKMVLFTMRFIGAVTATTLWPTKRVQNGHQLVSDQCATSVTGVGGVLWQMEQMTKQGIDWRIMNR